MADEILRWVLEAPPERPEGYADLAAWRAAHRADRARWTAPIDCALAGGYRADRLAYAFTAGYQAALRRLIPALPADRPASLCVTEAGGGHPRALETRLEGEDGADLSVSGEKRWISDAGPDSLLLVAATRGRLGDGRRRILLAVIEARSPGVTITPQRLPIVPEINHAVVTLARAPVSSVLPGDGYTDYVRPFRTVEDLHLSAAVAGLLLRFAAALGWGRALRGELLLIAAACRALAPADPGDPGVQIAADANTRRLLSLIEGLDWSGAGALGERWRRDVALMEVARAVRDQRLARAWSALSPDG